MTPSDRGQENTRVRGVLGRVDWKFTAPLLLTIIVAFSGYYYTYRNNVALGNRRAQLERVDRQLKELYGPLYALANASSQTWTEFRKVYRPTGLIYWEGEPPPTKEEAAAWRLWMREVFMPLNLEMEALILKHSDLLAEAEMPKVLLDLSAHIAGYKPVLRSWERGDVSRNESLISFPYGLIKYAEDNYRHLKAKQATLLGELDRK